MRRVLDLAERVAPSDSSLLIVGETGVGKEWLARLVHASSHRAQGPFVAVNCASLPGELVESELFGHEQGAFTGAFRSRRGQFELGAGGSVLLDEIGEMPTRAQAKLLRVLEERSARRVGGERPISVDARIIAATNRDPHEAVDAGLLRRDLFFRLGVITLEIPPLRERREDIRPLVRYHLSRLGRRANGGSPVDEISEPALRALERHLWPGNVRELVNVLERAVLLCRGEEIGLDDLPGSVVQKEEIVLDRPSGPAPDWGDLLEKPLTVARRELVRAFERTYLERLLRVSGGRVGEVAREAGIDARTLYTKMKRYGLDEEHFRTSPRR